MVVGLVVLLGILWLGRPLVEGRLAAARNLDRSVAVIKSADAVLATIDAEVRSTSASGAAAPTNDMRAAIPEARGILQEAATLSQAGYDRLTEDEQERAMLVKAAAATRLEAVDAAEAVLSARSGQAATAKVAKKRALEEYERAIQKVKQSDAALANK